MKVKIKKLHPDAVIPSYSKSGDAGMDLTALTVDIDENGNVVYSTGLAFEIPEGYAGLLFPRSSNSKKDLLLSNSVGLIDSGYRGELFFKFKPSQDVSAKLGMNDKSSCKIYSACFGNEMEIYNVGDRVGQIVIMPYPHIEFDEVDELSSTERGAGGYGSTGN